MDRGAVNTRSLGRIIVSDGESRAALAIVRSLGALGAEVHVLAQGRASLAGASRHASAEHSVPDPEREPAAWADTVARLLEALPGAWLLPVTEVAIGSCFASGLALRHDVALPPRAAYEAAVDKHETLERARRAGLDVPASTLVEDPAALTGLPAGHAYPAVLKARRSRWLEGGAWRHGQVAVVYDDAGLRASAQAPGFGGGMLVQEFVPGSGEGLFFLVDHGQIRARFAHRRLREKPPSGGVGVLCESITPDPALLRGCEALLAGLGWHGLAMIEFRREPAERDERARRAVVMEINPRPWGSLQLAIDAGVDFPALWLAQLRGAPVPQAVARTGVRTRWLMGDVDHLYLALRDPAYRRAARLSRAALFRRFARSFFDGTHSDVWRLADPRPFALELWRWLRG